MSLWCSQDVPQAADAAVSIMKGVAMQESFPDGTAVDPMAERPLEEQLPPEILATPSHMPAHAEIEPAWWRPGWADGAKYVGWRWIFLTPALGLLVLALAGVFTRGMGGLILVLGFKLVMLLAAISVSMGGYVVRRVMSARTEPFCIHCGYNLSGLPDNHRCPECGRQYSWRVIAEYRRDPKWFQERWKAQHALPSSAPAFEAGPVTKKPKRRDGT